MTTLRQRVIDPIIADIQHEYREAIRRGETWRARRVQFSGCWELTKSICLYSMTESDAGRTVSATVLATFVVTMMIVLNEARMILPGTHAGTGVTRLILFLVPSAIAIGLPLGFTLAALACRRSSDRRAAVLLPAGICALLVFLTVGWIAPFSNQQFRELAAGHSRARGTNELTIVELRREMVADQARSTRSASFGYQTRLSLSASPIVLGCLVLAISTLKRRKLYAAIGLILFTAYGFSSQGSLICLGTFMPLVFAAWLPNVLIGILAMSAAIHARIRQETSV